MQSERPMQPVLESKAIQEIGKLADANSYRRGTGLKGTDFKKVTQKELGKYEVEDQIAQKFLEPHCDG